MNMKVEAAIQRALVQWMRLEMTQFPIKIASNNNEHARNYINMGVDVGSPDLLITWRKNDIAHMFYLELKTKKGKLSKSQVEWNEDFDKNFACNNCQRAVAYGFSDAKKIVSEILT